MADDTLHIPIEQLARQAVSSLRGYTYQIYQSIAAWLDLKEEETLILEVAEDYTILAHNALKAVQVKDTPSTSVTLKSPAIRAAIESFWTFQQNNPDRVVHLEFLTTSTIGQEKVLRFPDSRPGLEYWRVAAREGADGEPIRQGLLILDLPSELKTFIEKASPEELKKRLLRRIRWQCGAPQTDSVIRSIRDRLTYFGDSRGLLPSDSERALGELIVHTLRVIVDDSSRQLTKVDFLRAFENATSISVSISTARRTIAQAVGSLETDTGIPIARDSSILVQVRQVPLPPRVAERTPLVEELFRKTIPHGSLWLQGSSGLGKTTLAQLIARQAEREWFILELRQLPPAQINYRLQSALIVLQTANFGGLIIDDFPNEHAAAVRLRLSILTHEMRRKDASIIVTSAKQPSASLKEAFGTEGIAVEDVPYLTVKDVADLVTQAKGEAHLWAPVIHTLCGFGHPQLVAARVSGLDYRNWPKGELFSELVAPGAVTPDVESERAAIRDRILAELPESGRLLLYRLSLVVGLFDRQLAVSVAKLSPEVLRPGEVFDLLRGPWIEERLRGRFTVSPLVSDAGQKSLSEADQMDVRRRVVDELLTRRPFPSDFLGQLLANSLVTQHARGLWWLSHAVILAEENERTLISERLFVLTLVTAFDKPIIADDIHTSAVFRLMQFTVGATLGETRHLPAVLDRLMVEANLLEPKKVSQAFLLVAIPKVLIERDVPITPGLPESPLKVAALA